MNDQILASLSAQFTVVDWGVVIGYLIFTTWLGTRMAGKQATIRDFFLGGRKLPWFAVSGSIIATEISALTFIVVPFIVFRPEGNFTYLQLGLIGTFIARVIVGYVLVPAYYEREIYSPYDYMGNQLGEKVRSMTTALFALGGILAQSARVYLTALVLTVVLSGPLSGLTSKFGLDELAWAIIIIGIVATIWTLIGGITTVIWTDVMLFLLFLIGAIVALGVVAYEVPGGLGQIFRMGWEAKDSGAWGKFTLFDFEHRYPEFLTRPYTIWAASIAATWGSLHPYGCDQLLVQRMFCCKGPREARRAMISSIASQFVTLTVALVGVGLFAYYQLNPLEGASLEMYEDNHNRIFPIFVVDVIPVGWKGLIIAGVLAAAISSLTSILAALSQTVMSAFYNPLRERYLQRHGRDRNVAEDDRHSVMAGRAFVLLWAVVLCGMAYLAQYVEEKYPSILDLGLAMAGYAGGALLAGFFLSFLPLKIDGRGYMWSAPLSVLYVFAVVWHADWTHVVCWAAGVLLLLTWILWALPWHGSRHAGRHDPPVLPVAVQTLLLLAGIAGMLVLNYWGHWGEGAPDKYGNPTFTTIAWPWYVPIGSTVAFGLGYLLARRRERTKEQVAEHTASTT